MVLLDICGVFNILKLLNFILVFHVYLLQHTVTEFATLNHILFFNILLKIVAYPRFKVTSNINQASNRKNVFKSF